MKKSFLLALVLVILTPSLALALAVSDENVTKMRPDKPVPAQVQEIRQELETKREEIRNRIAQIHATRLTKRFDAYYLRLASIITRFEARLIILQKNGKDIVPTQAKLDLAKAKLVEAKTAGQDAVKALQAIDPLKFSEQQEERLAARNLATSAHDLYKETLTLLKDSLKSLKTISKPALPANEEAL